MNYFAHGIRFLDRPWFLAGTAVPDWLSVADRTVRLRDRMLEPFLESDDTDLRDFASGVKQHLHDDEWFHQTRGFYEVTSGVADIFRKHLGKSDGFLPGFLGHILTELLLDRLLIERDPEQLQRYYRSIQDAEANRVQELVNRIAPRQTERLAHFVTLFSQIRFLEDYLETRLLLRRLNQVLERVKLNRLPDSAIEILDDAWEFIQLRVWELLPDTHFQLETSPGRTTT